MSCMAKHRLEELAFIAILYCQPFDCEVFLAPCRIFMEPRQGFIYFTGVVRPGGRAFRLGISDSSKAITL